MSIDEVLRVEELVDNGVSVEIIQPVFPRPVTEAASAKLIARRT